MFATITKIIDRAARLAKKNNGMDAHAFSLRIGNANAVLLPHRSVSYSSNGRSMRMNEFYSFRWKKIKKDIFVDPSHEPNSHMLITGMSGFGKSTLFKSMLLDINAHNMPAIIFDAHNEHAAIVRHLNGKVYDAEYSGINILELDGASVAERISELTRLFKSVYSLGYIQATKLSSCLWYTYRKMGARAKTDRTLSKAPTIKDLVAELNIFITNAKTVAEKNTLHHLRDRISLLNTNAFGSESLGIRDLQSGIHLFSLASIRSAESQLIYIGELLSRLYVQMKANPKESGIRCYVMIDEAQFLMDESSGSNAIIGRLIEEGRKYGFGVVIVSHAASTLNRQIVANASTFITFYAREPNEASYSSKVLSGGDNGRADAIRSRLRTLRQNEAMMVSGSMRDPMIVSTPRYDSLPRVGGLPMIDEAKALAATKHPIHESDISKMLSPEQIDSLVSEKKLDRFTIKDNTGEETFYMRPNVSLSIEHEAYVTKISKLLTENHISNAIVDNRNGPDIVAYLAGKKIAIEYETGKKALPSTIKMLEVRRNEYSKIIVVVNDTAFKFYDDNVSINNVILLQASKIADLPGILITA
ncbi:MAG: ATP-binding protein [Candidatus Micrarchaeota archaeon]|nr:ATP-binding protein [Candidatus Micrarchaeota archaeon]